MKTFYFTVFICLLGFSSVYATDSYLVDSWRSIPVTHDKGICNTGARACYTWEGDRKDTINFEYWIDQGNYEHNLEHEYGHNIYRYKLTSGQRAFWDLLFGGFYDYLFKIIDLDTQEQYVSDYAKVSSEEDFAETFSHANWFDVPSNTTSVIDLKHAIVSRRRNELGIVKIPSSVK